MSNETVFVAVVVAGSLSVVLNVLMFYILLCMADGLKRKIHSVFESLSAEISNTAGVYHVLSVINKHLKSLEDDGR